MESQASPHETAALGTALQVANFLIGHQSSLAATNAALGDRLEVRLRELSARSPTVIKNSIHQPQCKDWAMGKRACHWDRTCMNNRVG